MGTPALLAAQSGKILSAANQSSSAFYRRVDEGGLNTNNGSGVAAWVATVIVDTTRSLVSSLSGCYEVAAATNTMATTFTTGAAATAFASVVANNQSGTPVIDAVWSADAAAAALTDAEITTSLGHDDWVRLCDVTVAITGAAAGTFAVDNTVRSGVVSSGFNGDLATTESGWNSALSA